MKKQSPEKLFWVDETGVDQFLYREYGWAPKGELIYATVPGRKFERCSIVAAKCGAEIVAGLGYHGTADTTLFLTWIQKLLVPYLKSGQIVIMDNASIHKSPKIKEAIEAAGCTLVYLPPYSPDLNPIEHYWAHLKKKIADMAPNYDSMLDSIEQAMVIRK